MLRRREGTEKIEEKGSILSGMVDSLPIFSYRQRKSSFFNVYVSNGNFYESFRTNFGLYFGNLGKLEFVLKDA